MCENCRHTKSFTKESFYKAVLLEGKEKLSFL